MIGTHSFADSDFVDHKEEDDDGFSPILCNGKNLEEDARLLTNQIRAANDSNEGTGIQNLSTSSAVSSGLD